MLKEIEVEVGLYRAVKWLEAMLWQSQLDGHNIQVNKSKKKKKKEDGCSGAVWKCINYSTDPVRRLQLL